MTSSRHYRINERPYRGAQEPHEEYRFLRIGRIKSVNTQTGIIRIEWIDRSGEEIVRLTFPVLGLHGGLIAMPEEGSKVIVGWVRGLAQDVGTPVILGYMPENYIESLKWSTTGTNAIKADTGEIGLQSKQASVIYLDENVTLSDQYENRVQISSEDSSINLNSIMYLASNEAYTMRAGLVKRALLIDPLTQQKSDQVITQFSVPLSTGGKAFTEANVAVKEFGDVTLDKDEDRTENEKSPLVNFFAGTKVNSAGLTNDVYGSVASISGTESILEVDTAGSGANKGFTFHVSREGRTYVKIARAVKETSKLHDSTEIVTDGRNVITLGKDTAKGESVNSTLQGGVVSHVGKTTVQQHSYKATLDGGVEIDIGKTATGYSIKITGTGKIDIDVTGDVKLNTRGNLNATVAGNTQVETTRNTTIKSSGNTTIETRGNTKIATTAKTEISSNAMMTIKSSAKIKVNSGFVEIGASIGLLEKVIKGESFQKYFDTHVHTAVGGPTSPPIIPMATLPFLLSQNVKTT